MGCHGCTEFLVYGDKLNHTESDFLNNKRNHIEYRPDECEVLYSFNTLVINFFDLIYVLL